MGLTFKAQPIAWDAKDAELSAGTIDCIWNGFTINGRENDYTWSEPYLNNSQVFVVRSDSGITDSKGLAGKIVEVQTDSSAEAALSEKTELSSTFTVQSVADYNTAFMQAGKRVKEEGKENNLLELIAADPAFHLKKEDLERSMDPKKYVGRAPQQVERYLKETVRPILSENRDELGLKTEISV